MRSESAFNLQVIEQQSYWNVSIVFQSEINQLLAKGRKTTHLFVRYDQSDLLESAANEVK